MTINELIEKLEDIKGRNVESDVPDFDPGTIDVFVESQEGTYYSPIFKITQPNYVWLIVGEPNYEG